LSDGSFHIGVDPRVAAAFPDYRALVVVARGVPNRPSNDVSRQLLAEATERARDALAGRPASELPEIASWRTAFSCFGAKPSRFPSSAEALLKRVARGETPPAINGLVDCYNAVSLAHRLPIGGEDVDRVSGAVELRFAGGDEHFDLAGPDGKPALPWPGEVVWADDQGITCRCWNWRQGARTRLTDETTNAYFLLETLPPRGTAELDSAAAELLAHLGAVGLGGEIERIPLAGSSAS
jgi:DNA/RNA-binding domain of Phe-tRNA-synthetase-like protein